MSTNIVPFESMNLTAFAPEDGDFDLNAAASKFASVKFPVISLANGRFHVKREGESDLILRQKANPSDPDEPASYIDMVVLNFQEAKTFYATGYTAGSEAKPDCFSNDGVKPDAGAEDPQCTICATCAHNAWGSGTNEKGEATKGKACSDNLRLAVASPANLDEVFMLRVPPASLGNFGKAGRELGTKRVPLNKAVIRISFDPTKVGVVTFQPLAGLSDAAYAKAKALKNTELVLAVTGKSTVGALPLPAYTPDVPALAAPAKEKPAKPAVDPEAEAKAAKAAAKAAKIAAAQAALAAAAADEDDEDGEEAEAPAATPAPAATQAKASKAKAVTSGSLDAELDALLA